MLFLCFVIAGQLALEGPVVGMVRADQLPAQQEEGLAVNVDTFAHQALVGPVAVVAQQTARLDQEAAQSELAAELIEEAVLAATSALSQGAGATDVLNAFEEGGMALRVSLAHREDDGRPSALAGTGLPVDGDEECAPRPETDAIPFEPFGGLGQEWCASEDELLRPDATAADELQRQDQLPPKAVRKLIGIRGRTAEETAGGHPPSTVRKDMAPVKFGSAAKRNARPAKRVKRGGPFAPSFRRAASWARFGTVLRPRSVGALS